MHSIDQLTASWAKENGVPFWHEAETTSTNDRAKEEASTSTDPLKIFVTSQQSKGRGRHERHWSDTPGGGYLLSSWSYLSGSSPQHIMGPIVGLALFQAALQVWPKLEWSLKAPNDLYLKNKKLGGLLIETVSQGDQFRIIIGLGLNVYDHPLEVDDATHLIGSDGIGQDLAPEKWNEFLSATREQFDIAVQDGVKPYLSENSREELLNALNLFPAKDSVYLEVTESGDLVTDSQTISWHQL